VRSNRSEPVSAAKIPNEMANAIEQAGLHPAFVFAVRDCGFLLTGMNIETFSDDDVAEWEDALDRLFDMHPDADPM